MWKLERMVSAPRPHFGHLKKSNPPKVERTNQTQIPPRKTTVSLKAPAPYSQKQR